MKSRIKNYILLKVLGRIKSSRGAEIFALLLELKVLKLVIQLLILKIQALHNYYWWANHEYVVC
jgi:hypothetical protein